MTEHKSTGSSQSNFLEKGNSSKRDIPKAQETIYNYLLEIVKDWSPEAVLDEFKRLFVHHNNTTSSFILPCLYEIVFANQELEFRNTLKRSCYILINNWEISRQHSAIQELIQIFDDPIIHRNTVSPTLKRLRGWLKRFLDSKDFQELKLFAARFEERERHWSERYTSYLLVPQYIDLQNPIEQRQAARELSRQLKEKFKFDLAIYTARSEAPITQTKPLKNPTGLGDEVLRLVKAIVAKRGVFSYTNLANIFLNQTHNLTYREFKDSLQRYLIFSVEHHEFGAALKAQLSERMKGLYESHHDKIVDSALLLRTCNRIIEYLTTENHKDPSPLFILLLSRGTSLTLVIVLLKLILICRNARTHLEARIANLIQHYEALSEEECQWVVNFFEIFRIVMAIYTENVEFNLVSMKDNYVHSDFIDMNKLDTYRIFSQPKVSLSEAEVNQNDEDEAFLEPALDSTGEDFPSQ